MELRGAITALVTPFCQASASSGKTSQGPNQSVHTSELDLKALRNLVEFQIAEGIDGLVACGTTGESATLSPEEHARVVSEVVASAAGRVPVIAGAGSNNTAHAVELAKISRDAGADGLLLVCPYYNKPTQRGLEAHFRAILEEVPLPAMLYNVPGRTSCDLLPETIERLQDVAAIRFVKESSGQVHRVQEIRERCGERFVIFSGEDPLALSSLAVGAAGVVSVTSNIAPSFVSSLCKKFRGGDVDGARAIQDLLDPLHRALFLETNPAPVKAALRELELLGETGPMEAEIRLPLVWPSSETLEVVRKELRRIPEIATRLRDSQGVASSQTTKQEKHKVGTQVAGSRL